jgi:hypothetical protein
MRASVSRRKEYGAEEEGFWVEQGGLEGVWRVGGGCVWHSCPSPHTQQHVSDSEWFPSGPLISKRFQAETTHGRCFGQSREGWRVYPGAGESVSGTAVLHLPRRENIRQVLLAEQGGLGGVSRGRGGPWDHTLKMRVHTHGSC